MGEVYRAHDERLDRDVAVKVLPADALADDTARKRFRKEALALSKLNHPNIATVHDFDTQDGADFLVMEYVEGATLSEKITNGPLSQKEVFKMGAQVADALEAAHEKGIIHRDLKPGNVMVTPKGQAKVLDFGIAKLLRRRGRRRWVRPPQSRSGWRARCPICLPSSCKVRRLTQERTSTPSVRCSTRRRRAVGLFPRRQLPS